MKYKKTQNQQFLILKHLKNQYEWLLTKIKHPPNTVNLTYKDDNYVLT
jgi:hypothetical protein